MAKLLEITRFLDSYLKLENFSCDAAVNGLQFEAPENPVIKKIALAVDAGESVIEKAIEAGADLIITHHGLFWSEAQAITGPLARKISSLASARCSLYSAHLPLDGHPVVGNGMQLGKFFGLKNLKPEFVYGGQKIGACGHFTKRQKLDRILTKGMQLCGAVGPLTLNFGTKNISKVGLVTGSGSFAVTAYETLKLDLLISGEAKQEVYHLAKELRANVVFFGHYATETLGVIALGKLLQSRFKVKTFFVDEQTGI